jgi:hypothetical protein
VPKRAAIDKQEAFLEFKQTEEGISIEENILHFRATTKERRGDIKRVTDNLNKTKHDIDKLKAKLDRKEHERRQHLQQEQIKGEDEFGDEPEDIIDEEELVLLREMKDLKKEYRDMFGDLKINKQDHHDA